MKKLLAILLAFTLPAAAAEKRIDNLNVLNSLRLSYDAGNYLEMQISDEGQVTVNNTGASAGLTYEGLLTAEAFSAGMITATSALAVNPGTVTAPHTAISSTVTWNNAAVNFGGISLAVNNTASAAGARLLRLNVSGVPKFDVDVSGNVMAAGAVNAASASLATPLPVASGGTGASTAAAARINLGLGTADSPQFRTLTTLPTAAADVGLKIEYATGAGATSANLAQFWSTYWTAGATSQLLSYIAADGSYVGPNVTLNNNIALLNCAVIRSSADGRAVFEGWSSTTPLLAFQGVTSSFPGIKRNGTTLQVRLADDSGYATIDGRHILQSAAAPGSASATGTAGEVRWDGSYLYLCTATNTWRRIAHSTW